MYELCIEYSGTVLTKSADNTAEVRRMALAPLIWVQRLVSDILSFTEGGLASRIGNLLYSGRCK